MRVVAGTLGGRKLRAPRGQSTRPTADRIKEAMFSILGPPPTGACVLDLFCGSGGLGIEALSRGAASAVFVDKAATAIDALTANLEALQIRDRATMMRADFTAALGKLVQSNVTFDWVFLDPPYAADLATAAIVALGAPGLLAQTAVLVVEHDKRAQPYSQIGPFSLDDRRRYGDTELSFYVKIPAGEQP